MPSSFRCALALAALMVASCSRPATAPVPDFDPTVVPRELRAVWVATVANIDWPSRRDLTAQQQRAEMIDILDRAQDAGFNAIIMQVRPASDAVYRSELEPWAALLTGQQGTDPGYDPLAFAITEAHARGLELHAWINPFRAGNAPDTSVFATNHVWNAKRGIVRVYGAQVWLDPGEAEARDHSLRVVTDIVRRYDVDGIHMDDYFYPYPVANPAGGGNLVFPDSGSYARSGSALPRDDWRRQNIDNFVEQLYREAHAIKPAIKVGISPFGIWRPGNPPSVQGFDAYAQLYADARKWLRSGWVDYFVPQLYWAINAPQQSFPALLDWWLGENPMGRHVWPGLATYRAAGGTNGFSRTEIADQVKLMRARPVAQGHVMYNTTTTLKRDNGVLATITPLYADRALSPTYSWLDATAPSSPGVTVSGKTVQIAPAAEPPRFWFVRAHTSGGMFGRAGWETHVIAGDSTNVTLGSEPSRVLVRAVDASGNVSAAAEYLRP